MSLLLHPRSAAERIERIAVRPHLESTRAVARVGRFDGRSRVVAVRDQRGWHPVDGRWTWPAVEGMRCDAVHEVLLRRGFRRARVLLAWLPTRAARA